MIDGRRLDFEQRKTDARNIITLPKIALRILDQQREFVDSHWVFELPASPTVNSQLKLWFKKAGVHKHAKFHMSRHTAGVMYVNKIGVYATGKILGHRDLKATEIYVDLLDETKDRAADEIDRMFEDE
jgi:integrase